MEIGGNCRVHGNIERVIWRDRSRGPLMYCEKYNEGYREGESYGLFGKSRS